jgi:hypothetical protein
MQTLCFVLNALFRLTEVVKHPFYSIGPKMISGCVSYHFDNLRHGKDGKLVFEAECTSLGYQSCEASILVQWTQNDVWGVLEHISILRHVKVAKLVFELECTTSWYQSCETSILVHWTQMIFGRVSEHLTNLRHVKI